VNRYSLAVGVAIAVLAGIAIYSLVESRRLDAELLQLREAVNRMVADDVQLREQLEDIEVQFAEAQETSLAMGTVCDRAFPGGLYRLKTNTDYGTSPGDYEIYHVSVRLSEWNVNVGTRLNSFGIPTDLYFDYDGDGRIDTALAARFVREIPVAGNTLAARLLADSRVHQNLYAVFSCEWRNAEFTSSEDMNSQVSGTSNMLWDLVQDNSESIVQWIRGLSP
jgi:hypothetical protein